MRSRRPLRTTARRFSSRMTRRKVARSVSLMSRIRVVSRKSLRELSIPAAVVHQRRGLVCPGGDDLADEDRVIATFVRIAHPAFECADRAFDEWHTDLAAAEAHP